MKNYLLLLALAASFAITSCGDDDKKKEDPTPVVQPTKTQLITAKSWKMTKQVGSANGSAEVDVTNYYSACQLDNLLKFAVNGTLTHDAGATKCDPSEPQILFTGAWIFTSNETKLKIADRPNASEGSEMDIVELTATKMTLKAYETDSIPGSTTTTTKTITTTYTAQ